MFVNVVSGSDNVDGVVTGTFKYLPRVHDLEPVEFFYEKTNGKRYEIHWLKLKNSLFWALYQSAWEHFPEVSNEYEMERREYLAER